MGNVLGSGCLLYEAAAKALGGTVRVLRIYMQVSRMYRAVRRYVSILNALNDGQCGWMVKDSPLRLQMFDNDFRITIHCPCRQFSSHL